LGITAGLVQAVVAGYSLPAISILIGALLVAATGFVDDWSGGLSVSLRFLVQTFAAGIVVFQTGPAEHIPLPAPLDVPLGVFAVPVTMLWIVGVINIYNFLDGIDGYAGAQGVIGGIALALCASEGSGYVTGLAIAGSCAGFLLHNWHKARVFMGDVGSATLGFLFATIPLGAGPILREQGVFVMSIALWFFLADGVFTLIRRLIAHEKIWEAHRSHLYQRLAASGYRHDHVVAGVMIPAFALCILGVVSIHARNTLMQWGVVLLAVT
jgi:UDP-N-acetylmuramyl pentapeptide phosphotransferase/UDP-N-acetylglucosamine-1-phosphate transferase